MCRKMQSSLHGHKTYLYPNSRVLFGFFYGQIKMIISIDPGVKTGFALFDTQKTLALKELKMGEAVEIENHVLSKKTEIDLVIVEDARICKYAGGKNGDAARMGVGSVKRDCGRWEEFLVYHGIPYVLVDPRRNKFKKINHLQMVNIIGKGNIEDGIKKSNEHERDAAMMGYTIIKSMI